MPVRPIRTLLRPELVTAGPEMSVEEVARLMAQKGVGAVPVLERDRLVGIFSERDLLKRVVAAGLSPGQTRLAQVMTSQVIVAHADESLDTCLERMKAAGCRHLPVVSAGSLLGMVSLRDLLLVDVQVKDKQMKFADTLVRHSTPASAGVELIWKCLKCGHHLRAEAAPARCPGCGTGSEEFVLVEED